MESIGFIGLGKMGGAIEANLIGLLSGWSPQRMRGYRSSTHTRSESFCNQNPRQPMMVRWGRCLTLHRGAC